MIDESSEEIDGGQYYDFTVHHLFTMTGMTNQTKTGQNARTMWMEGWYANLPLLAQIETDAWCEQNSHASLHLRVWDNGAMGDGMRLSVDLVDLTSDPHERELISVRLSPRQALALGRALLGAVSMRETDR